MQSFSLRMGICVWFLGLTQTFGQTAPAPVPSNIETKPAETPATPQKPTPAPQQGAATATAPAASAPAAAPSTPVNPSPPVPVKLTCKAIRGDLGIFEALRFMSLTIDVSKKYVKMVHDGDGAVFEFTDGASNPQGHKAYVRVNDENIAYGQGRETWKIDRYTGTLTNPAIGIPFDCQLRATDRKF